MRGRPNQSRETHFSGANGDRDIFIFPVQLTTSKIGNFTRLIHTLLSVLTIHTYYGIYIQPIAVDFSRYYTINSNPLTLGNLFKSHKKFGLAAKFPT